jgi:glycosyltransferase involved in cell wall biosynthesis
MKIAVDVNQIARDGAGITYVMRGLVRGAAELSQHTFLFVVRSQADFDSAMTKEGGIELPDNVRIVSIPKPNKWMGGGLGWYFKLSQLLRSEQVDALVAPTLAPAWLFFNKTVQIINDLSPISKGKYFSTKDAWQFAILLNMAKNFTWKIATISKATKQELVEKFPNLKQAVTVIPLGLNKWVSQEVDPAKLNEIKIKYELINPFILSVSTIQPRKNYVRAIQAFAQVAKKYPNLDYVIVGGKGWFYQEVFAEVEKLKLQTRVKFLGYLPDQDMPAVFALAKTFAYVSLEEGFGLPLIEARAVGLPVVCSQIPVFVEVQPSTNIIYVDPLRVVEIAEAFEHSLTLDRIKPESDFFAYYSWQNCWKYLLELIAE